LQVGLTNSWSKIIRVYSRAFAGKKRSHAPRRCHAGRDPGMRDARDLLLAANRDNPKALGDFGNAVDDSPQAKTKTKLTT
jgi:hypothetical protein